MTNMCDMFDRIDNFKVNRSLELLIDNWQEQISAFR